MQVTGSYKTLEKPTDKVYNKLRVKVLLSADGVHMARVSKYQTIDTAFLRPRFVWNAGLYIRLSREDGDKAESESVSSQRAILERFISAHPEINLYDNYIDDGWSGTDFNRPAFQRMLADITGKRVNCVIVKDLSRFGRNYVEAGKYLETVFPLFNIRFISVNDNIDSSENPQSVNNVIVPFKNIINDEYCRDISMKVRSALDIRRRQGKFIGSFAAYGYKKDETDHNRLIIDEYAAQTVRLIYDEFLKGYSIIGITRKLNDTGILNPSAYRKQNGERGLWTDSTVRRILTNELYIGNLVQKKNETVSYKIHVAKQVEESRRITVKNTHEGIVARDDFYKVQALLRRDTRTSPSADKLSVFAGFIKCADCGRAMQKRAVKQKNKLYAYYVCSSYKRLHRCSKHAVRVDLMEQTVLAFLNKYIKIAVDFDKVIEKMNAEEKKKSTNKRLQSELDLQKKELIKTQNILTDLYPDYKNGVLGKAQYMALKEQYDNRAVAIQSAIERLEKQIKTNENGLYGSNEFIETFKKYRGLKELSRDVVIELIENIFIHDDGTIEIRLKCKNLFEEAAEYLRQDKSYSRQTG